MSTIESQCSAIVSRASIRLRGVVPRALNVAAHTLRGWAANASHFSPRSGSRRNFAQALKVRRATDSHPEAAVYLDDPGAIFSHERHSAITIRPKVSKFLWVPLTRAGRYDHVLHAHDAKQKRLSGWMPERQMPVGLREPKGARGRLDFLLLRSVTLPRSPVAGFLTTTARNRRWELFALVEREITKAMQ